MPMNPIDPLVSVITPAYNRASYLDETIESVLSQDYPNLEYIVLDDGSKDNTVEVLQKYTGKVIWESHANMGETRTVNKAIGMSKGEIICIVNSDDPLLPHAIRTAVDFMASRPEILVAYPNWLKIGPQSELLEEVFLPEYDYFYMVRQHHCIVGPGAFIRRKTFDLSGGPRDPEFTYVADYEFWLRAGLFGPFARIPEILATFRVHPDSASKALTGKKMAGEHIRLMNKYYDRPDLPENIRAIRKEAFSWAHFLAAEFSGPNRWLARWHFLNFIWLYPQSFLKLEWARKKLIKSFFIKGP